MGLLGFDGSAKLFHELSVAAEISYDRMQSCAEANVGCQDWQRDRVITFYRYAGQWLAYHNALLGVITQGLNDTGTNVVEPDSGADAIGALEWVRGYLADAANGYQEIN